MATSLVDADSLLAIDIGHTHTRAILFDAVEDRYRVVAIGIVPTRHDDSLLESIRGAIGEVQEITRRPLLDLEGQLVMPAGDTQGVDQVVLTLSGGAPLRVVIAGVLPQISLESARRLAETTYGKIVAQFHLNDRLHMEGRINAMVRARPDVIIMAGGLEGGASQSVLQTAEAIGLAAYLLPPGQRPEVLYAGNSRLQSKIKELLESIVPLRIVPNLRPSAEQEQIAPAQEALLDVFRTVRERQMPALQAFLAPLKGHSVFYPTAYGFERVIRFLSRIYDPSKGVLGVDLGAETTTIAAAWNGRGILKALPELGLGQSLPTLLRRTPLQSILRWLPVDVDEDTVADYLYNKALYPDSVPLTAEELAIEQAAAREVLREGMRKIWRDFPQSIRQQFGALLPSFEPVLASGSILTKAASPAQALLLLLDGIQPSGVTTFVLDTNHLLPSLGAAADLNPILGVQTLQSHHFVPLATVITAAHRIRKSGVPILRLKVSVSNGEKGSLEIKTGQIKALHLRPGQTAEVEVRPLHGADAGFGPGKRGLITVHGSTLGLVMDGRGRPVILPTRPGKQREQNNHWLQVLGG